ncbi:ParB/RepB/Spo0J family partition protein [Truepera radiovictrix]|uniref:ParB-like partition protein n=1 Tax=Truepera radiovictrix (strain DSM 17093 / CIP 108686 / LMG 22925 / RQ-24) TaxID=649638 RepID=D7CWD5_TRURR|nr:ParB/RepB/Spo0J family partition protein [Truepera radiovictrix]ADI16085.1 parB-like partition protein [Truepera radiovictrix DSM 17093]WMT58289.1 ParB/RepB/Spo0J family partition protein [Truepera radiovictrix]
MSAKRSSLGRGLDALLPKVEKGRGIEQLPLEALRVSAFQPRKRIDPAAIAELASSVAQKGVLQPLLVRPADSGYEIVAGERRFRAAQQVGLATVPAIVKPLTDRETLEIALIENLQRESLSAVEEARAFKQLMDFGLNQEAVAQAVGKSRSAVANTLRLLQLDGEALAALDEGRISAGHARAILSLPEAARPWALRRILEEGLSVRQAERLEYPAEAVAGGGVPEGRTKAPAPTAPPHAEDEVAARAHLEAGLTRHLGTKVRIVGATKGRIELHFFSPDELQRLLELLHYRA